ncbi:response regulator [Reinekea marina]|uniref:HD domain-containing phosphohydrolase n=1 Tax=Reinekea marina TaxID=1310421 RepID=A0ABV7WR70_9GAMM|nr:HD domain-containing phosphohydrolase [Reinekea marina]MDN3651038.1 response regulator [Reinekea marina]
MTEISSDQIKILFVDDEENILKTLKRLMSFEDYECFFASNGKEGLELLQQTPIDIIISDMRMPEMNGDDFLAAAREICPNSMRFILSGYSDFTSMIKALNEGGVHQFISKPWDDEALLQKIHDAAESVKIRSERDRLRELTERQAQELKDANQGLEAKVKARTNELEQTSDMLDLSFQELKASYGVFIDVIAQVLSLRSVAPKDYLNDIADTAKALAAAKGMNEDQQDHVYKAAKLHELGKIRIPENILKKPLTQMSTQELKEYKTYPMQGYALLASLDNLGEVANYIQAHSEHFNGKGFPNRLSEGQIPLGSRIISICMYYFMYRNGLIDGNSHDEDESEKFIRQKAGQWVDPDLVEAFLECAEEELAKKGQFESRIALSQAQPGIVLSRDLFNVRGVIMLTKGTMVTLKTLEKLRYIAEKDSTDYTLYIEVTNTLPTEGDA